jgi:hypothetical protein
VKTWQQVGVKIPTVFPAATPEEEYADRLTAVVGNKPYFPSHITFSQSQVSRFTTAEVSLSAGATQNMGNILFHM